MACKKIRPEKGARGKGFQICKMKGDGGYSVTLRRMGRYGGYFIDASKDGLTKREADSYMRKLAKQVKGMKIKRRRTPYP